MDEAAPPLDAETKVAERPADHQAELRLWLRLLTCTTLIERGIRRRLRERYAMTLPRFDLMAQLERAPAGLRMGELSRRMMVTGGNVTGIADQLVAEGFVERRAIPGDRRVHSLRLTERGHSAFGEMAREHERWIVEMAGALAPAEVERLHELLGRLKASVRSREPDAGATQEE